MERKYWSESTWNVYFLCSNIFIFIKIQQNLNLLIASEQIKQIICIFASQSQHFMYIFSYVMLRYKHTHTYTNTLFHPKFPLYIENYIGWDRLFYEIVEIFNVMCTTKRNKHTTCANSNKYIHIRNVHSAHSPSEKFNCIGV